MAAKTPSMQAPVELALGLVHRIRLFLGQARPRKQQLPLAGGPPSPGVVKHVSLVWNSTKHMGQCAVSIYRRMESLKHFAN